MADLTVDMAYGRALFEASVETGKEPAIRMEAQEVLDIMEREPDFRAFMDHPGISAGEKKEVISSVFSGRLSVELLNLMYILVDNGRTSRITGIIKEFIKMTDEEEGVTDGKVCSVEPLSPDRIRVLEEETSRLTGRRVRLVNETDPGLMAGFTIYIDGKLIDASFRRRFDELYSHMGISQRGEDYEFKT